MHQELSCNKKTNKGFNLIELMVVVAIIGVFALLGLLFHLSQQVKVEEVFSKDYKDVVEISIQ